MSVSAPQAQPLGKRVDKLSALKQVDFKPPAVDRRHGDCLATSHRR